VRFLIVDDNAHMLNIIKTILRGFGAVKVFEAKDPDDAFVFLSRDSIDIVVLDYVMGEEDGVAFLRRLRRDPKSPAPMIPVIMLTAHSEKARVEAARDVGVNEFCSKPITPLEMLRKISAVIGHPRPFVRTEGYFGPDRRRRRDPAWRGPERRGEPESDRRSETSLATDDGTVTAR
jgi:two-component system chemotaxis response regulator CheY